jgi:hypothetical protein
MKRGRVTVGEVEQAGRIGSEPVATLLPSTVQGSRSEVTMTRRLKSLHRRAKASGNSGECGVTFKIPTVTRMASRFALNRGGRGQDAANEFVASIQGEVRRVARAAARAVTS